MVLVELQAERIVRLVKVLDPSNRGFSLLADWPVSL